jgi:RimJ/RimL family protein N-acetyltransferase
MMLTFSTERLVIRPLLAEDELFFCQLYTDNKVMRHTGGAIKLEQAKASFQRCLLANQHVEHGKAKTVLTWAIVCGNNGNILGLQTLAFVTRPYNETIINTDKQAGVKQTEIGIMLAREANGKKIPEEALGALIKYAFTTLQLDRIHAFYNRKNFATKRFVDKLGFSAAKTVMQYNKQDISHQYLDR